EHGHGLGKALRNVDADVAVAMVNPGEERRFVAAGLVPTPRASPFIRKRLAGGAPRVPHTPAAPPLPVGGLAFFLGRHCTRRQTPLRGVRHVDRLIFATQKLDPRDPVLAATVPMARALAERVDELVVLCDSAVADAIPRNARVHEFGAATQVQRGARFEAALARELRPRPIGVVAHMVPLYAVIAAPLVRPLRIPLVLWYTHWK